MIYSGMDSIGNICTAVHTAEKWEVKVMNNIMSMLSAVVLTGDDSTAEKWIWIMVVVGVVLVALAAVSVVMSKKKNAEAAEGKEQNKTDDKK